MDRIRVEFSHKGRNYIINRKGYQSEQQFRSIAIDLVGEGIYSREIHDRYDLGVEHHQLIPNTFRAGPGLIYLVNLIETGAVVPHNRFWDYEVGRNVRSQLNRKEYVKRPQPAVKRQQPVVETPNKIDLLLESLIINYS